MQLVWNLHPEQINVQQARSAAFQYMLLNYNDGRAELNIRHRGDRPSAKPVKRFVYKNRNGAFGGAQRFEDKHGYRDPAQHAPAEIVPYLPELPESVVTVVADQERKVRIARLSARTFGTESAESKHEEHTKAYTKLCRALLCCQTIGCYGRTEIDKAECSAHDEEKED
jgi:hypothetical protein